MDEVSLFNDVYSDMFSLEFDNLFSTIEWESFESKGLDALGKFLFILRKKLSQVASDKCAR